MLPNPKIGENIEHYRLANHRVIDQDAGESDFHFNGLDTINNGKHVSYRID